MSLNVCAHKVIEFFTKLKVLLYSSAKTNTFAFRLMQAATRCTKACSMHRSLFNILFTPRSAGFHFQLWSHRTTVYRTALPYPRFHQLVGRYPQRSYIRRIYNSVYWLLSCIYGLYLNINKMVIQ